MPGDARDLESQELSCSAAASSECGLDPPTPSLRNSYSSPARITVTTVLQAGRWWQPCASSHSSPKEQLLLAPPPRPGLPLAFRRLTYRVPSGGRWRRQWTTLLHGASACLVPGELTAVMGASGSGKSCLLDVLAARKTAGALDPASEVLYGGRRPTPDFLRANLGYLEQADTLLPNLTVWEMLLYTAELKRPQWESRSEKVEHVEQLIARLNLQGCRATAIGHAMRSTLSGGEMKRVSLATVLITEPRVLLLDEVTSGLDSCNAYAVMQQLKELATENITVCCSIHSPPADTFSLIDRVLLLQKGRVVYFGSSGTSMVHYFQSTLPGVRELRLLENIADYVMELTDCSSSTGEARQKAQQLAAAYQGSGLQLNSDDLIQSCTGGCRGPIDEAASSCSSIGGGSGISQGAGGCGSSSSSSGTGDGCGKGFEGASSRGSCCCCSCCSAGSGSSRAVGSLQALLILWRHRSLNNYRSLDFVGSRIADKAVLILFLVTLYWSAGDDPMTDPSTSTSVGALLFMWCSLTAYSSMAIVPSIVLERPLYLKERADGLYTPATFLVFKTTEELALAGVASLPFSLLMFYLTRLQGSFLLFWLVYLLSMAATISVATLIGVLSPSMHVANAACPAYASTLIIFSGFFITWDQTPVWWRWYSTINYLRYSFGALMVNEFGGPNNVVAYGDASSPLRVLEYFGLEGIDKWSWLGLLAPFLVVFPLLSWLALVKLTHHKR